jgi:hypothetical protein
MIAPDFQAVAVGRSIERRGCKFLHCGETGRAYEESRLELIQVNKISRFALSSFISDAL